MGVSTPSLQSASSRLMGVEIRGAPFNRKSRDHKENHGSRELDVRSFSMRCHGFPAGVALVSCVSKAGRKSAQAHRTRHFSSCFTARLASRKARVARAQAARALLPGRRTFRRGAASTLIVSIAWFEPPQAGARGAVARPRWLIRIFVGSLHPEERLQIDHVARTKITDVAAHTPDETQQICVPAP